MSSDVDTFRDFRGFLKVKGYTITSFVDQLRHEGIMNVSRQTVSNWNRGKHQPTVDKLKKMADFFGFEVADMYKVLVNSAENHNSEGDLYNLDENEEEE